MGILKAIVGAAIAGLGTAATAVTDGHVTVAEWIAIASTTLVALYGVWQAPNATPKSRQPLLLASGESGERVGGYPGGQIKPPTTRAARADVEQAVNPRQPDD